MSHSEVKVNESLQPYKGRITKILDCTGMKIQATLYIRNPTTNDLTEGKGSVQ